MKALCPRGHPLADPNVYTRADGRGRECKECRRLAQSLYRARRKAEWGNEPRAPRTVSIPGPRADDGTLLPTISEEAVRAVRASSYMTKEEREALGIHSRWMVWAIRKGVRR